MTPDRFTRMVEPHLDVVHRLARRLCRTRSDAEDLAQEALVRAFEKRASLRDPARVRPWILALLRNLHLNRVRDEKPHLMVLSGSHPTLGTNAEPRGNLAVEIEAKFLPDELLLALRSLPEEQASAIWLREVEGLSYEEVAEAMETPVGTVRSRLSRARAALIERLQTPNLRAEGGDR